MFKILIYDESLSHHLETHFATYETDLAWTTEEILSKTFEKKYDLYIVHFSALHTIESLRDAEDTTPAIFIDDYYTLEHMKLAFLHGDDYLIKPLYLDDLAVRIDYHYRKRYNHKNNILIYKDFYYHSNTRQLFKGTEKVKLSPNELKLLELLLTHINQPLNKMYINDMLESHSEGSLRVYISKLNKLGFNILYDRAITSYLLVD